MMSQQYWHPSKIQLFRSPVWKIWSCFLLVWSLWGFSLTQANEELMRSLSYDSGYTQSAYSNRATAHFGVEFTQLHSLVFDQISLLPLVGDNIAGRSLWGVLGLFASTASSDAYTLSYHQFGHGTRLAAIGLAPEYIFVGDFDNNNKQANTSSYDNFFDYFSQSFGKTGGLTRSSGNTLFTLGSANQPDDWDIVVTMGGVNNEMTFADLLEETVYFRRGHAAYLPFYLNAKLAAGDYVRDEESGEFGDRISDMSTVSNYYKSKEYEITLGEIKSGSDTALALSFTTYSLLYSFWTYITEGDPTAFTLELWGFRLPDVDFYLNRKGLSYKIKSGFRLSDSFLIPFALEQIYKGESFDEASLGLHLDTESWTIEAGIIGSSYQGYLEFRFLDFLAVSTGFVHYDVTSLFGERNIPSLKNGNTANEVWGRFSMVY